ncbi:MAG: Ada metal-binding domain-containing protein [Pseudomonadota bacterium]
MTNAYITDDEKWAAIETRDQAADGAFWSCVKTTGIYCRPSCPGRPHRKNVLFAAFPAEARANGFRACKRCDPDGAVLTGEILR